MTSHQEPSGLDRELYDLCKEVYRRTKWKAGDWWYERIDPKSLVPLHHLGRQDIGFHVDEFDILCPLYTSDYLLEKLPRVYKDSGGAKWIIKLESPYDDFWNAYYCAGTELQGGSSTPLKALLKLVLALDDAKELA